MYAPHSTSPTGTLQDPEETLNFGITCDTKNNVFTIVWNPTQGKTLVDEYVGGVQSGLTTLPIPLEADTGCGIKPDDAGNLLVCDTDGENITEYTEAGTSTGKSVSTGTNSVYSFVVRRDDRFVLLASIPADRCYTSLAASSAGHTA